MEVGLGSNVDTGFSGNYKSLGGVLPGQFVFHLRTNLCRELLSQSTLNSGLNPSGADYPKPPERPSTSLGNREEFLFTSLYLPLKSRRFANYEASKPLALIPSPLVLFSWLITKCRVPLLPASPIQTYSLYLPQPEVQSIQIFKTAK